MSVEVILRSVTTANGKVYATFSDGTGIEFGSMADVQGAIDSAVSLDQTRILCLAWAKARSSNLSNINTVKDKRFVVDFSHSQPVRVL
jgi:hypothetical protein